jgi:hypothetical protein
MHTLPTPFGPFQPLKPAPGEPVTVPGFSTWASALCQGFVTVSWTNHDRIGKEAWRIPEVGTAYLLQIECSGVSLD